MHAGFDSELRQQFLVESGEMMQRLSRQLVALEKTPADAPRLNAVFRVFHTLKGGAGFLGFEPMVVLCHHVEDLLGEARKGLLALTSAHMDSLLEATDRLEDMMACLNIATPLTMPSADLLRRLMPSGVAPVTPPDAPSVARALPIEDAEFEALLDTLYGTGAPGIGGMFPLAYAPLIAAEGIADDEFEAILDALHGKRGHPGGSIPPAERAGPAIAPALAQQTVRIDTRRLDVLVSRTGELVLVRNRLRNLSASSGEPALLAAVNELDRVVDALQGEVLGMRMQLVGHLFQRFPRVVRDLARQLGKDVELVLQGEDTELDRSLVEALADPLIHLLRNALDHGVENPEQRARAGKARKALVHVSASQRGERIVISVRDDGAGMDPEVLRQKAVEKGLLDSARAALLSDAECYELIFRAGFSTADAVSEVSGRGVGMDVVKTRVAELGGTVQVRSQREHGTEMELTVPLTLAIFRVLLVRVGERILALPLSNVEGVFELAEGEDSLVNGRSTAGQRRRFLPLADLGRWVDAPLPRGQHVVVVHIGHVRIGCRVHAVLGREDVVVTPLGPLFEGVPGIAGATVTGDGDMALVLDLASLSDSSGQLLNSLQATG